jgi:hypothetical protein
MLWRRLRGSPPSDRRDAVEETRTVKAITEAGLAEALRKAEHYRLLNEPEQAESICLDVLAIRPDDAHANVVLILALTDQFGPDGARAVPAAQDRVAKLSDEVQPLLLFRSRERAPGAGDAEPRPGPGSAYEAFREAMSWYEQAEARRPTGNDDAILRWNSCLRTIRRERLQPQPEQPGTG